MPNYTRESHLKRRCREHVEEVYDGRLVHVSPKGVNGYPDSDLLIPNCPIVKIEFKRARGATLRPGQERWVRWLSTNNIPYWVIGHFDDFAEACANLWIDRARRPAAAAARGRGLADG